MKKKHFNFLLLFLLFFITAFVSNAQMPQLIKRTTYKNEKVEFGVGGTISIVGAPEGSVTVEGWNKNEVEISAEIEMQAASEADLNELSKVNGFTFEDSLGSIRIHSVGTHDKDYMKRVAKKFPKKLLNLPFTINYTLKVPSYSDLDINTGKGDLKISGVEGAIIIKSLEGNADLSFKGGNVLATFGKGDVNVNIEARSWRGRQADFKLASGNLNVKMPENINADINASILRTGKIENNFTTFKPRERSKFSETNMLAKAGSGGAVLAFTVGDGNIKLQY